MDLHQVLKQYHSVVDAFSKGDPEPAKRVFSHRGDVTLANPSGPVVRGWKEVSEALDLTSSLFRDGKVTDFETFVEYKTPDLTTILGVERWKTRIGRKLDMASFELRVRSTFRREDSTWKLVHRHADPIVRLINTDRQVLKLI